MPVQMPTACPGALKKARRCRIQGRGSLLFVGDHFARSVRGIPCAPASFR